MNKKSILIGSSMKYLKAIRDNDFVFFIRRFSILLIMALVMTFKSVQAQVTVNIVYQPLWGPIGYDYVEYYYLPEPDVYYYVPTRQFIYLNGGNWVYVSTLPSVYRVDLYRTYKVVINEPHPYHRHTVYVTKYGKYKTWKSKQVIIRDSRDKKYYVVKGHPRATKVKVVKPKSAKPATAKTSSSKVKSAKPATAKTKSVKPAGAKPAGVKPKSGGSKSKGRKK